MSQLDPATFESTATAEVYKQVERNGPQPTEAVRSALSVPEAEFETAVERLTEQGYLETDDGQLALAMDLGGSTTHGTQDFEFVVRPATAEDFEALLATVREIADKKTYVVAERLAAELAYDGTVTRRNGVRSRIFFVATVDGDVVGWSHLDLPLTEKLSATAELTVGVRPDYRGYSVGTALLDRALEWAESRGSRKVYKNLARTNMQAVSFLEARGWEQEGIRTDHYTIGHKLADQVMMAYTF